MKKHLLLIVLLPLLLFGLIATVFYARTHGEAQTLPVTRGDLVESVYGLGTVTANQSYQLKIGVTTAVQKFFVREGDSVASGAPLVKLEEGSIFRAPFSGTITAIPFKPRETVYPQMPIVTLMNLSDRYIVISLEQEGALRVRSGQAARMSFETIRGQTFTGTVRSLFPGDNQFLVHIDVPNLPPEVLPGMTGDVAIEVARRHDVLLVPIRAVQSSRVLVRDGRAHRKVAVTIGAVDGRFGEVLSGELKPGDEVVIPKE